MDQVEYCCTTCGAAIMMEPGFVMTHYGNESHGFQLSKDDNEVP